MTTDDPVVITGLACRYPDAAHAGELWENVLGRRRGFRRIPPGRLPLSDYGGTDPDRTYVTHAGLIDGWQFDRARFRVPGAVFRAVDLTHWLALEVSAAALADAGLPDGAGLDRERTGVVLGNSLTGEFSRAAMLRTRWPYVRRTVLAALAESAVPADARAELMAGLERRFKEPFAEPSDETLAGALSNTIAGRICNHFDLHGTGYTVDGACSSSLLAVSTAAGAVAEGQLDVALAGGVDLSIDPFELVGFARVGALAATGEMRVYDRRPTGFLPGEGCGVVVLCRQSYARRHGMRAYARLLGWGSSADGSGGLTRPEVGGQKLALRRAYERAQLPPERVGLVEGHGTGTEVGDRTELRALLEVRGPSARPAALGSVKANIGHTKAAAGVAGLIKAVLAVHHEVLPPTTGCEEPHPMLTSGSLEALDEARCWPDADRYASVSAMGFGGINVHAVLGGAEPTRRRRLTPNERSLAARPPRREVIACGADGREHLVSRLTAMRDVARTMSRAELTDLAATLAAEHGGRPARFGTAVAGPDDLVAAAGHALAALASGAERIVDPARRVFLGLGGPLRVGLLCSGQASPCYPDAGALAGLLDELPPGYDDELPIPRGSPVDTAVAQPAIVRATLAGLRWLEQLGVRASGAVGHSLGELTALVWAGALDEEDAYALAQARGAAMSAIDVPGEMAALAAGRREAEELIRGHDVVIAAENGEQATVISGPRSEVEQVMAAAARRGAPATRLPVSHAFHSPLMAPAASRVKSAAAEAVWRPLNRPVASTVTGAWLSGEDPVELLVQQLTGPVRFREALALLDAGLLIEVGPGSVLTGLAGPHAVALDAGAPGADGIAAATAALFAAGVCDSVAPYVAGRLSRGFDLDRPRTLLTNPCETVPAPPVAVADAPVGAPEEQDPIAVVLARVADAVELDPTAIAADTRLLADLHLSSLRVMQLAVGAATELGRAVPSEALPVASLTVREFAEAIVALPVAGSEERAEPGATWVRAFAAEPAPAPDRPEGPVARRWHVVGGHPPPEGFPSDEAGEPARLLVLPSGLDRARLPDVLEALHATQADRRPLVVLHQGGIGAAVGRSVAAELPDVPVLVVETSPDASGNAAAVEAHRPLAPYAEIVLDGRTRTTPALRPLAIPPRRDHLIPLRPGEPCVVTGGTRGIGAECAAGLAAATGARMVLLGRGEPGDDVLARVAATGAPVEYHGVDVTDRAAVAAVLADLRKRYGPVRMALHAAGHNVPARIEQLTADHLRDTLAPKVIGLENLLAATEPGELRRLVTFGSVIGRMGLAGEAHYAIANEWLARAAGAHVLNIEWSAWSGAGMGERLGVLDGLIRRGLSPIPVPAGVDMLLRLLVTPDLPPTVLVAGRLPSSPALRRHDEHDLGGDRFLESVLARTPGVEVEAEARLSLGTDPYLDDHRIDDVAVLPAVLGLEAMAQAAAAVGSTTTTATGVRFGRAITVPDRGDRVVRVTALAREDGITEVVGRSDETGLRAEHFRAEYAGTPAEPPDEPALAEFHGEPIPAGDLYGPLFFHGPRFRRVLGYRELGAYGCVAEVRTDPDPRWFSQFLGRRLRLGDPGARDAFLHVLQGCVPDRRVLPVAVDRIQIVRRPSGTLRLHAWQRAEDGADFVFDLVVVDATGALVERWDGLALRAVHPLPLDEVPLPAVGAYLTRSLRAWRPGVPIDLVVTPGEQIGGCRLTASEPFTVDWRRADGPDRRNRGWEETGAAYRAIVSGTVVTVSRP
jgi:enediyne polyketide synthase